MMERTMLDNGALRELEATASHLAAEAGAMLLQRFRPAGGGLEVEYKSKEGRDPVTSADRASEEYIRAEIGRRYPGHAILSEETPAVDAGTPDVVWVVDPLDGTANYLNGLPVFAVSIGLLERGRPVAGALFVPSITDPRGAVMHARAGGGAYSGRERIRVLPPESRPGGGGLAALPASRRAVHPGRGVRRSLGEVRVTGSIAYEMAAVASGVFQYALIGSPHIWDVAAGVVLAREAGAEVLTAPKGGAWRPLDAFSPTDISPSLSQLREWRSPLIVAPAEVAPSLARHLRRRFFLGRLLWPVRRITGLP